jgi:hypothetical protein
MIGMSGVNICLLFQAHNASLREAFQAHNASLREACDTRAPPPLPPPKPVTMASPLKFTVLMQLLVLSLLFITAYASAAGLSCGERVYDNQNVLCPSLTTEAQCNDGQGNGLFCYWSNAQCEAFPAKAICTRLAKIAEQAGGLTRERAYTHTHTHTFLYSISSVRFPFCFLAMVQTYAHAGLTPTDACAYLPQLGITGCEYDPAAAYLYCQCTVAYVPPPRSRTGWGDCQGRQGPPGLNAPCLSHTNSTCEADIDCVYEDGSCVISKDGYCSVANVEPACGQYGTEVGPAQCAQNPLCKWYPAGDGLCETNWVQECPYLGCALGEDQFLCRCLPTPTPSASPTTAAPTTSTTAAPSTAGSGGAMSAAAPPVRARHGLLFLVGCMAALAVV